jgi:ABC-type multidrug transport system ATPase subunit
MCLGRILIFCDLYGLDSYTAFQLLETLSRLAARGRTIVLSLHQPRSDAFALFSRILLLSRGSVVYSGRTRDVLPHFEQLGHALPDAATNPLDFLLDISSVDFRSPEAEVESKQRVRKLVTAWCAAGGVQDEENEGDLYPEGHLLDRAVLAAVVQSAENKIDNANAPRRPGILRQTAVLLPRAWKGVVRGWPELVGHIVQAVGIGLLMGASSIISSH